MQKLLRPMILLTLSLMLICSSIPASSVAQQVRASSTIHNTLGIISGTGSFASVPSSLTITVSPGQELNGKVTLDAKTVYPADWVAPLIVTPSWGDAPGSWRLVTGWLPTGESVQTANIDLVAPQQPGTYYIIFAFSCEISGDDVASATNWRNGPARWGDGDDLADLNATQIAFAQENGFLTTLWLNEDGHYGLAEPAVDAIQIIVDANGGVPATQGNAQQPVVTMVTGKPVVTMGPGNTARPAATQKPGNALVPSIDLKGLDFSTNLIIIGLAGFGLLVLIMLALIILIVGSAIRKNGKPAVKAPDKKVGEPGTSAKLDPDDRSNKMLPQEVRGSIIGRTSGKK